MSLDYIENRIKEALKLAKGNRQKARQQVIAWTYEDDKLLHALAKPHLSGIVAFQIERVASGRSAAAKELKPPKAKAQKQKGKAKTKHNVEADEFGMGLLKAVTGEHPEVFGLEDPGAPRHRQGTSKKHIEAINILASKGKKKK